MNVDPELFGEVAPHENMHDAIMALMPYIENELSKGTRLHSITRHLVGAFAGVPGARAFRRYLAEVCTRPEAGTEQLIGALRIVSERESVAA